MALNFPNTPSDGDRYEAPNGTTYIWDGTDNYWKIVGGSGAAKVIISGTPPTALPGSLWWDTGTGEMYLYYADNDSSQWVPANAISVTGVQTDISVDFLDVTATSINDQSAGRNILHNGDFRVTQRAPLFNSTTPGYHAADRWYTDLVSMPNVSVTTDRSNLPSESGFGNAYRLAVTTAGTNSTDTICALRQTLEAQDVAQLLHGTIDTKQVTVSFWIQSNLSGDVTVEMTSQNGAFICSQRVAIEASDASSELWAYKTVTFPINLNGLRVTTQTAESNGLTLALWLGVGSTYTTDAVNINDQWIASATGASSRVSLDNIQLGETDNSFVRVTGMKAEIGPKASPFEYVPYAEEFSRCSRYYYTTEYYTKAGTTSTDGNVGGTVLFPNEMRDVPTVTAGAASGAGVDKKAYRFYGAPNANGELLFTLTADADF